MADQVDIDKLTKELEQLAVFTASLSGVGTLKISVNGSLQREVPLSGAEPFLAMVIDVT